MRICREQDRIAITTPAKLNLFLEVLGRQSDGYHQLDTLMIAISLCDQLAFRSVTGSSVRLQVEPPRGVGASAIWAVPSDGSNLVVRALEKLQCELGVRRGMEVTLQKGIPALAGLGGGSSDAAAAIVGGFAAWGIPWNATLAGQIAAQLGSDVNFFLESFANFDGAKAWAGRCLGRGEQVRGVKVGRKLDFVVAQPPQGCSTAKVFRDLTLSQEKSSIDQSLVALADGNVPQLGSLLFNRLESPALAQSPWIGKIRNAMSHERVAGHGMSGSGSSRFALCDSRRVALTVSKRLQSQLSVFACAASSWHAPSIESQLRSIGLAIKDGQRDA